MLLLSDGPGDYYDQMDCKWNIEVQGPITVLFTELSTADDDEVTISAEEGANPQVYHGKLLPQSFTTTGMAKRIIVTFTSAASKSKSVGTTGSSGFSGFRLELYTPTAAPTIARDDAGVPLPVTHAHKRIHTMRPGRQYVAIRHDRSGKCPYSMMVSGTFALYASSRIVIPEGATSAAMDVMGMYTKVPRLTQGGFPVYQRVGPSVQHLFFWPAFQRWLVGPDYNTGLSSVQSHGGFAFGVEQVVVAPDGPSCPDEASDWVIYGQGGWVSTFPITVREGTPRLVPSTQNLI